MTSAAQKSPIGTFFCVMSQFDARLHFTHIRERSTLRTVTAKECGAIQAELRYRAQQFQS